MSNVKCSLDMSQEMSIDQIVDASYELCHDFQQVLHWAMNFYTTVNSCAMIAMPFSDTEVNFVTITTVVARILLQIYMAYMKNVPFQNYVCNVGSTVILGEIKCKVTFDK